MAQTLNHQDPALYLYSPGHFLTNHGVQTAVQMEFRREYQGPGPLPACRNSHLAICYDPDCSCDLSYGLGERKDVRGTPCHEHLCSHFGIVMSASGHRDVRVRSQTFLNFRWGTDCLSRDPTVSP